MAHAAKLGCLRERRCLLIAMGAPVFLNADRLLVDMESELAQCTTDAERAAAMLTATTKHLTERSQVAHDDQQQQIASLQRRIEGLEALLRVRHREK